MCNSYVNAISIEGEAIQSTKLMVDVRNKSASLRTIKEVKPHQELFTDYGGEYVNSTVAPIHFTGDSLPTLSN